jgi:hypothetical protein
LDDDPDSPLPPSWQIEQAFEPLDQPKRDRIYGLARRFLGNHVRMLRRGSFMHAVRHDFEDGALVISDRPFRKLPLLSTRVIWAVHTDGRIVDVTGHRVGSLRLRRLPPRQRPFIWAPGSGDHFDVPFLLANVSELMRVTLPEAVAATGEIADLKGSPSQVLGSGRLDRERLAAETGGMAHLVLPFMAGFLPAVHGHVRYWPVRDANEAIFSMLTTGTSDTAVPDLKRRWRNRAIASWVSLAAVLAGASVMQFASLPYRVPVVNYAGFGIAGALLALSAAATHVFWRIND